ncbi:MAG: hypothetical protein V1896_02925 [Candidatus Zambryskibacteria bacterium]
MNLMNFVSPGLIFTVLALLVVFGYWIFNFIILYHLLRFGIGVQPKKFAAVFLLGSILLFSVNVMFFANINLDDLKNLNEIPLEIPLFTLNA